VKNYCRACQAIDDKILRRMRMTCWIHKGYKYTLRVRNAAFQLQQYFHERSSTRTFSVLLYTIMLNIIVLLLSISVASQEDIFTFYTQYY
jgi:hypothetical protein